MTAIDAARANRSFTFRGDADPVVDPTPVPADGICRAAWVAVPYLGRVRRLAELPAIVLIAATVLRGYLMRGLATAAPAREQR